MSDNIYTALSKMTDFHNDILDSSRCGICYSIMERPVCVGSCGHTFCKPCLTVHEISHYKRYGLDLGDGIPCPTCYVDYTQKAACLNLEKSIEGMIGLNKFFDFIAEHELENYMNSNENCDMILEEDSKPAARVNIPAAAHHVEPDDNTETEDCL